MKNKSPRIFFIIFTYTMFLVLIILLATVLFFWRQFLSFLRAEQIRQLSASLQPVLISITEMGRTPEEMIDIIRKFADSNQSFRFRIKEESGNVLFATSGLKNEEHQDPSDKIMMRISTFISDQIPGVQILREQRENSGNRIVLIGYTPQVDYGSLVSRSLLGILIMFAVAVLGPFIFARKITKPLEDEIVREKTIEESQRLFFSAASHELKTPIAAARALVESMIANWKS